MKLSISKSIITISLLSFLSLPTPSFFQSMTCPSFTDCFTCSTCNSPNIPLYQCSCFWDTNSNTCTSNNLVQNSGKNYFWDFFSQCNDTSSKDIQLEFCGVSSINLDDLKNEIEIGLEKKEGKYGKRNLFCGYEFYLVKISNDNFYKISLTLSDKNVLNYLSMSILVFLFDGGYSMKEIKESDLNNNNNDLSFVEEVKGIKEIQLKVLIKDEIPNNNNLDSPFSFIISKNKNKSKTSLYLAIGVIVAIGALLIVLFILVYKKYLKKNKSGLPGGIRGEVDRIRRLQNNMGGIDDIESNQNELDEYDIQEFERMRKNQEKIELMLKTTLAPQKFFGSNNNENYLEGGGNKNKEGVIEEIKGGLSCTICLTKFKEGKSKVSITPCHHVFHYKCLSVWLLTNIDNPKCPNCNNNLIHERENKDNKDINNRESGGNITNNNKDNGDINNINNKDKKEDNNEAKQNKNENNNSNNINKINKIINESNINKNEEREELNTNEQMISSIESNKKEEESKKGDNNNTIDGTNIYNESNSNELKNSTREELLAKKENDDDRKILKKIKKETENKENIKNIYNLKDDKCFNLEEKKAIKKTIELSGSPKKKNKEEKEKK